MAERCQQGVKEIKLRLNKKVETVWRREVSGSEEIISYTKTLGKS